MKANKVFTIALATVFGATIMSVGSAFGAEEPKEMDYPQNFDCTLTFGSPISDFAVYGDNLAFAHSNSLYILYTDDGGERQLKQHPHTSGVSAIDFDGDGKLYFKDATEVVYHYSASSATPVESHEFQSTNRTLLTISDSVFYTLDNPGTGGVLTYRNNGVPEEVGSGFSLLKTYGGKVYAVKENVPYVLDGSAANVLDDLKYTDFDEAKRIPTGDAKEQLKKLNENVETYEIKDGAFYTKINKNELGETFEPEGTTRAKGNITCLLLYGNSKAAIVASGNDCYITAWANLEPNSRSEIQSNKDGKTYYALTDIGVYSSPFMSENTKIATLKSGHENSVKVIERFEHAVLSNNFCKISYEVDGQTVTGYVAANYLTVYDFAADDNKPTEGGDKEFNYDTNVPSVILAIVIVALVIIAILYVALIWSKKDKNNEKKKKKKEKEKKRRQADDDETEDEE